MKISYYFNDLSGVLTKVKQKSLDTLLLEHSEKNGYQNVVVLIPHRNEKELKDICFEIFNENKIGTKEENNGLLLVLVHEEKKIRIMTGKGINYIFSDTTCKNIIERKLRPLLDSGDYEKLVSEWITSSDLTFKREKTRKKLKKIANNIMVIIPFAPALFLIQSPSLIRDPSFLIISILFALFVFLFRKFGIIAIKIIFNATIILLALYLLIVGFIANSKQPGVPCVNTTILKECRVIESWSEMSSSSNTYNRTPSTIRNSGDFNNSRESYRSPTFEGGGGSTYGGGYGD